MNSEKGNLISLIKEFINKIKLFFKHKKEQLELLMKKRKEEKKQKINNEKQYNKLFVGVKTFFGYIISVIG